MKQQYLAYEPQREHGQLQQKNIADGHRTRAALEG
jgi:hypothetical protein